MIVSLRLSVMSWSNYLCTNPKALDAAVRSGKSPHYLSTDFISAQQKGGNQEKRRSNLFNPRDIIRRGSRESLDGVGDMNASGINSDEVSLTVSSSSLSHCFLFLSHCFIPLPLSLSLFPLPLSHCFLSLEDKDMLIKQVMIDGKLTKLFFSNSKLQLPPNITSPESESGGSMNRSGLKTKLFNALGFQPNPSS